MLFILAAAQEKGERLIKNMMQMEGKMKLYPRDSVIFYYLATYPPRQCLDSVGPPRSLDALSSQHHQPPTKKDIVIPNKTKIC